MPHPQTPDPDPYLSDYSMYDDDPAEVKAAIEASAAVQAVRRRVAARTPDPAAFTADLEDALTQLDAGDMALDEAQEQIQQAHDRHVKAVALAGYALSARAALPTQEAAQAPAANGPGRHEEPGQPGQNGGERAGLAGRERFDLPAVAPQAPAANEGRR